MKLYRIRLHQLSPFGSEGQSDTLFGHLCWQKRFRLDDGEFAQWLAAFDEPAPPFVLSDLFAADRLPRPMLRYDVKPVESLMAYAQHKQSKKNRFLTPAEFRKLCRGQVQVPDSVEGGISLTEMWHASIDRTHGTTGGEESSGQLYSTDGWLAREMSGHRALDLYARATDAGLQDLLSLLSDLSQTGFGRDKGVGYGQFELSSEPPEQLDWDNLPNANGFVNLSSYVPAANDPTEGRYRLRVKEGRLGESFAADAKKLPLLQIEAGAVFRTKTPRPVYGRMIKEIAPDHPEVVQCGLAVAVPIVVP